jgi:hypothetical protein
MRNILNQTKMNKYIVFFTAVGLITMASCTPAKKESKQLQVQQQTQEPQPIAQQDTSAAIPTVTETVPAAATPSASAAVNATATPPELNPPHGQPFHRCEIPVGSPLNTVAAAKKPATPAITSGGAPTLENAARLNNPQNYNTQVNTPAAPAVTNASASGTPPKLNPPHGQPFHKCEIPVGSPLN